MPLSYETICRNQDHIKEIEHESLLLLHEQCIDTDRKIVNTNSTGKDSMVVNHLQPQLSKNLINSG